MASFLMFGTQSKMAPTVTFPIVPVVGFGVGRLIVQEYGLPVTTVQLLDQPPKPVVVVVVKVTVMPAGTLAVHVATEALGAQLIACTGTAGLLPGKVYVAVTLPFAAFGPTLYSASVGRVTVPGAVAIQVNVAFAVTAFGLSAPVYEAVMVVVWPLTPLTPVARPVESIFATKTSLDCHVT
jgi:hypothetical protein